MKPPAQVRVIGGQWKRSVLPVADVPGLRPSPSRVRETLFNWLGQTLPGWQVLDAFAGSGALGFEAASRGASKVLMLERHAALARSLQAQAQRLGATATVQVTCTDALAWMGSAAPAAWDLVLLDPPFDAGLHGPAIAAAWPLLREGGLLYVEAPAPPGLEVEAGVEGFAPWRSAQAGAVWYALFRK